VSISVFLILLLCGSAGAETRLFLLNSIGPSSMSDIAVDRDLDLSGEVCPYTFVRSKLAMETMASGQW
jgi:hypothetical protein